MSPLKVTHLKQVNEGEKAASEGHGIAKVNVTKLQNQEIETAQLRETLGEDALEMAEVRSTAKKVPQMEEKVGEQEYSRYEAINLEIKNKEEALVKLFEEKNSKGEEEKARSEQRLGEAELKTKSWLHKHSPDHVQPAALQDKLDQEQRENELDQHRGVAEHEAELRGEVKLVQLRAEQGFPLKQDEDGGRKAKKQRMVKDWSEDGSQESEIESIPSQDSFLERNCQLEILCQLNRIFSSALPPFTPEVRQGSVQCMYCNV